jgi:16S rRNA (guanine(966)-N(2))-methyltransferase RsmD
MRVIAGSAKGLRLATVPDGTRPMSDRAREGLFSSLGTAVQDARVLDLFAGTGALGIEALSRGAARAVFVDDNPAAAAAVRENLNRTNLSNRGRVLRRDARRALHKDLGAFDLALLDPPYDADHALLDAVLADLAGQGLVSAGARVALTRRTGSYTPVIPLDWRSDRRLSYGDSVVLVFQA